MDDEAASREEAETALQQGDWASVSVGLRWLVGHAEGSTDFDILVEMLRYPTNIVPMEIAAEALIRRYGSSGLAAVITFLVSDEIDFSCHDYLLAVLDDLYLDHGVPIRDMLMELDRDDSFLDITDLLDRPTLAAGSQGSAMNS
ncbi:MULTISPECIES: hypothetical protein [unclassified Rhodococcus (in: high G+C Gram-positive bacteria)]|uniref:hypothetical protein n=1 Tax=unclassified Rhodococcus (in: high G+C Gram-positive bacteria) TaxID=192944 RepID=UPI00117B1CA3|nr:MULTISPECIES: hypothetical protein [unclassified Rhodococcus (in: high G+C Gram-positive bacteria)]